MKKFTPSKDQQKIYDFITDEKGNAIVDAVAGSGKSTTIINSLQLIPEGESVLFLAFNKSIVEELKSKVAFQENVEVMTLHSLGARSIRQFYNSQVDGNKYRTRLSKGLEHGAYKPVMELDNEELSEYKQNIKKLIDLVRVELCDNVDQFMDLANKHDLDIMDNECEIAAKVVRWGYTVTDVIDFTDMIYFPVMKKMKVRQYDWVFIDECQDLNAAQRELFLKCVKPETGRFIAVGDPRQAIYGFAGADVLSFNLLGDIKDTIKLPLSVCYRCDTDIINMAQGIVPQIQARDNAPKGEVNHDASIDDVQDGDMILCRVNAPLATLCMRYIVNGIKAYIKGKDIGLNLINMIKKARRENIVDALEMLEMELDKLAHKIAKRQSCSLGDAQDTNQYQIYADKVNVIEALSEALILSADVIIRIEELFSDDNTEGICLSSIHKSKGLESDRVFIACPDKLKLGHVMHIQWMAEQESNLEYVAYTRAKHYLGFITDFKVD